MENQTQTLTLVTPELKAVDVSQAQRIRDTFEPMANQIAEFEKKGAPPFQGVFMVVL